MQRYVSRLISSILEGMEVEAQTKEALDQSTSSPSLPPPALSSTTPSILSQFEMSEYQYVPCRLFSLTQGSLTLPFPSFADLFERRRTTPFSLLLPRFHPTTVNLPLATDQQDGEA